jgi:hypothetical protein
MSAGHSSAERKTAAQAIRLLRPLIFFCGSALI